MTSEAIRQILSDVDKFLSDTLKKENKLSKKTVEQKQQLLDKLQKFFDENPDYKPVQNLDTSSGQDESVNTAGTDVSSKSDGSEDTNYIDEKKSQQEGAGIGLIPAADLKSVVFSGFLEKKQKKGAGLFGRTNFQKRWCVVQAGIFYYFTSQNDKKQNGAFILEGYKFRNCPDIGNKKADKDLCFELYHDNEAKRFYQFMAKSKTEYEQWQSVIECGGFPTIEEDIYDFVEGGEEPPVTIQVENEGEEYEEPDSISPPRPPPPPSPKSLDKPKPPPPMESLPKPPIKSVSNTSMVAETEEFYDDAVSVQQHSEDIQPPLPPPLPNKPTTETATPPPAPPPIKRIQRDLPPPPPEKKRIKIKMDFKPQEDFENRFYGKWDCMGDNSNELTFKKGDIIHILSREFDEKSWWVGELGGKFGLVPKSFLVPAFTAMA